MVVNQLSSDEKGKYIFDNRDIIEYKNVKYYIKSLLGKGAYGSVVKAHDNNNNYYAIKIHYNFDSSYTKAATNEINFLKKMKNSKHTIKILESFELDKFIIIIYNLLYSTLSNLYQNYPLDISQIRNLSKQLLESVKEMFSYNIMHCDLKPDNIMIDNKDNIYLIDFGLASEIKYKIPTSYIQTIYYRAPEVIEKQIISKEIDLWSIGCIIAELFILEPLYEELNSNKLLNIIKNYPPRMRIEYFYGSDVFTSDEENLINLIEKLLIIDPKKRITVEEALSHEFFN
jgi:serine/threonine protein kinase